MAKISRSTVWGRIKGMKKPIVAGTQYIPSSNLTQFLIYVGMVVLIHWWSDRLTSVQRFGWRRWDTSTRCDSWRKSLRSSLTSHNWLTPSNGWKPWPREIWSVLFRQWLSWHHMTVTWLPHDITQLSHGITWLSHDLHDYHMTSHGCHMTSHDCHMTVTWHHTTITWHHIQCWSVLCILMNYTLTAVTCVLP